MTDFNIHPELEKMLYDEEDLPSLDDLDTFRAAWTAFCVARNPERPVDMAVEDLQVSLDGHLRPVRIYRPTNQPALSPCILYFHGGGWVVNNLDTNDGVMWGLAQQSKAILIGIHYRLAPENPYPAAFDDSYNALIWAHEHAAELGIDPTRIVLCGDSAGGNLSAAVSLVARDRGGPAVLAQVLIYPCLSSNLETPAYQQNAEAPVLTKEAMRYFMDAYLGPDWPSVTDPYALPLFADNLSGLPPAYIHTAEFDPLRDDGLIYAGRLAVAGVPVIYRCAERMVHSFMRARFDGPALATEFAYITTYLKQAFTWE
ncbi:MAG: alpha/beta hydrolase [Gammaproteobacteria bacterium]|nr:alpha/beta hydrolase [Gammaproteobacteria bacterium]